jgi:hypothetical protein
MSNTVVEKTWEIPAHGDTGPATITLRMPEVMMTDPEGRHIVSSPAQPDLVSTRMRYIVDWMDDAASWMDEEVGD